MTFVPNTSKHMPLRLAIKAQRNTCKKEGTHGHVVADEVPVAFIGVELDRESTSVTQRLWGARLMNHGGEPGNQGSLAANFGQKLS